MIMIVASALGALGGGRISLDQVFGLNQKIDGLAGALMVVLGGSAAGALVLLTSWRPRPVN